MAHEYRPAPMSLAQRAALRSQQPRALRQPRRRRVYPIVILLLLLAALLVAVSGFEFVYRDRVYPNVHVRNVAINAGGQTQAAVAAELYPYSVARLWRTFVLFAPGHAPIFVAAHRLGYHIDRGLTAWRAYTVGHNGSLLHRAVTQVRALINGATVSVAEYVDQVALRTYLFALAPALNRKPRPGIPGRRLDVAAAQRQIGHLLLSSTGNATVSLPFIRLPALPLPKVAHHHRRHTTRRHHAK